MNDLVQCQNCKGRKQLTGLGNMLVDCHGCKGIGYITFTNKTDVPILDLMLGSVTTPEHKVEIVPIDTHALDKSDIKLRLTNKLSGKGRKAG